MVTLASTRASKAVDAWPVIRAYWVSCERWRAAGLVLLIVALDLLIIYRAAELTFWQKEFYDTLSARIDAAFWWLLVEMALLGLAAVVLDTCRTYLAQMLEIRWRDWLTQRLVGRWLEPGSLYRLQSDSSLDNMDQRIADDIRLLASMLPSLVLGLLSNIVSLLTFSTIVWQLSGMASLALGWVSIDIPGYMLWAAVLYALLGSVIMEKFAGRLVQVDYEQQRVEANFRRGLVRLGENAEQVALQQGQQAEREQALHVFDGIRGNWRRLMQYTKRVTATDRLYLEGGSLVAYGLAGPRYFAGHLSLGDLMQLIQAFMKVRAALSWFIYRFKDIALLRSVCIRLAEFDAALQQQAPSGIERTMEPQGWGVRNLQLCYPDGRGMLPSLDWSFAAGQRWLLQGAPGLGKSTLLKAMAGHWPHGSGQIVWPSTLRSMFVPQRSYLPLGTLQACVCYPATVDGFERARCAQVLKEVGLSALEPELQTVDDWAKRLSPGQQQLLAFARVLLHRPQLLFLDEASSALDGAHEARMHQLLLEHLPGVTVVSIAHRESVRAYHTHVLHLHKDSSPVMEHLE